eukprot:snap_masked-scaffold_2-processed-gene-25.38-mRNA-1 protein AED:1.00 eAED:1.00 QI:0/0/0/0/1/1/2/0/501
MIVTCVFCTFDFNLLLAKNNISSIKSKIGCCPVCYHKIEKNKDNFRVLVNFRNVENAQKTPHPGIYSLKEKLIAYETGDVEENVSLSCAKEYKPRTSKKLLNALRAKKRQKLIVESEHEELWENFVYHQMNEASIKKNGKIGQLKADEETKKFYINFSPSEKEEMTMIELLFKLSERILQLENENFFSEGVLVFRKKVFEPYWLKKNNTSFLIYSIDSTFIEQVENFTEFSKYNRFIFQEKFLQYYLNSLYFSKSIKLDAEQYYEEEDDEESANRLPRKLHLFNQRPNRFDTFVTERKEAFFLLNFLYTSNIDFFKSFLKKDSFFDPFAGVNTFKQVFKPFFKIQLEKDIYFLSNDVKNCFDGLNFYIDVFDYFILQNIILANPNFPKCLIYSPPFALVDISIIYFMNLKYFNTFIVHLPNEWNRIKSTCYRMKYLNNLRNKGWNISFYTPECRNKTGFQLKFLLMKKRIAGEKKIKIKEYDFNSPRTEINSPLKLADFLK